MVIRSEKKVILYLLKNFEETNLNQIAKRTKISVSGAFKVLKKLEKEGVVCIKNVGNNKIPSLNLTEKRVRKLCELYLLEERNLLKGVVNVYALDIERYKKASLIVLFGSILTKKTFNDVDVLFLDAKPREVGEFCLSISEVRTKPVSPMILVKKDFVNGLKNDKDILREIVAKGIVLKGEDKFVEVMADARRN